MSAFSPISEVLTQRCGTTDLGVAEKTPDSATDSARGAQNDCGQEHYGRKAEYPSKDGSDHFVSPARSVAQNVIQEEDHGL